MALKTLTHEKILAAAVELINNDEILTFSKLATILGTRSQALYNYYPNIKAIRVTMVYSFYNDLFETLQKKIEILGEKANIIEYGLICRRYGIEHYPLMRLALAIPGKEIRSTKQQQELRRKHLKLFNSMLEPLNLDYKNYLIISRALRNLIIGEISNVGSGWFNDPIVSSEDSFRSMLELLLKNCQKHSTSYRR